MRNIKLTLEFDGTDYHGWQRQKNNFSVQECIENAILKITGEKVSLTGCGRTDAGVHALHFVCNFYSETKIPADRLLHALNCVLPKDIIIFEVKDMPQEFHARFLAKSKTYQYRIINNEFGIAFLKNHALHFSRKLDLDAMKIAAEHFLGEHDFSAFMAAGGKVKTTVRTITDLKIARNGDIIEIEVSANGFLYNMVRIITGTLLYVGIGKLSPHDIPLIIKGRDRTKAGITVKPQGLYLKNVVYGEGYA